MRVNFKEFNSSRRFGVELEVSATKTRDQIKDLVLSYDPFRGAEATTGEGSYGWSDTHNNDYWHIKYDSTCGPLGKRKDHGWEIASYIASGIEDIDIVSGMSDHLGTCGLEVNNNCGLHIHVEVKDFSSRDMGSLMAKWVKIEPWLFAACPSRRSSSSYCRPLGHRQIERMAYYHPDAPDLFWHEMMPTNTSTHNNPEKKYTLNTVGFTIRQINPFYDRGTVELRMPDCQLDRQHVRNWILLFLNFVETSGCAIFAPKNTNRCQTLSEVFSVLGLGDAHDGSFQILDHTLFNVKVWFLKKLIENAGEKIREQAEDHLEFITQV